MEFRLLLRFLWVTLLASLIVSFLMRWFLDETDDQRINMLRGAVLWTVSALIAVLDAIQVRRRLLHRQTSPIGICKNCGYNLTGNVSGVCPECGTAIPPEAAEKEATA